MNEPAVRLPGATPVGNNCSVEVHPIRTPGLGDTSYLLSHAGYGLVVDPQRDLGRFLEAIERRAVHVTHVLETHLHNDYVSGGRELARRLDADLVLPAAAGAAFAHVMAFHQEDFEGEGGLAVRPLHTPGHTPEHTSYLVLLDAAPVAVFSGGSLLVRSAGRTDLLGPERARQLARAQFGSVRRLADLPGAVELFPTHGEGSFCASTAAGKTTSTIGAERAENPVLAYRDADSFADAQLAGLQPYPSYYAHMGPINLLGPSPMPSLDPRPLDKQEVERIREHGSVIDARPRRLFAAGHIPGSLGIEAGEAFSAWVGWLTRFGAPLALVVETEDARELAVELARIGFDQVEGFVRDLTPWAEAGELSAYRVVSLEEFAEAAARPEEHTILDVRTPAEWERGHVPGSLNRYVPELAADVGPLEAGSEVWVACESGLRSTIAAGLLERGGLVPVVLDRGGVSDLLTHPALRR